MKTLPLSRATAAPCTHHLALSTRLVAAALSTLSTLSVLAVLTGLATLTGCTGCTGCSPSSDEGLARRMDFGGGWTFHLGDEPGAWQPGYDDTSWRRLNLPHDWAIEGNFSADNPSGTGGGALPGGVGWYRKTFTVDRSDEGRLLRLDFDGSYMNTTVWINGHELGTRPYGYISFSYDLTPYINYGGENVVAVRVDNAEQPNSRWYSGCGIYRNVWLTRLNPVHVALWGTYITADAVTNRSARIRILTRLENGTNATVPNAETGTDADADASAASMSGQSATIRLVTTLLDAEGQAVGQATTALTLPHGATQEIAQEITLDAPHLWGVSDPYLYQARTEVVDSASGEIVDTYLTPLGIRTFAFDAKEGFILNGERMKINGVCLHHDAGCLGAVVNRRAIARQLETLKAMGCNGIRCSHNPPAPELLDLCDRMGFIVMDETFDMWRKRKTAHDYARYFNDWHERDLTDLVVRDRNHPSVFIWSIGNEVLEQWTDVKADTLSLAEANLLLNFGHGEELLAREGELSVNALLTRKLAGMIHSLDPTRPVTAGCNEPSPRNHLFQSGALDIIGFNYHDDWFAGVPENFPGQPFIITESVSALMTRGYYRMPSDSVSICPERWDKPYSDPTFACSSYDNCHVPWGNSHEGTLRHVKHNDFISGQYIWTGYDYLGEPTPYGWPARSSYFGLIDLAGFPKDIYYMYQSEWRPDLQVLHLFPHWNWQEGQDVDLWAYYNNADEVELWVNGESQGTRTKGPDEFHVVWRVPFHAGTVRAEARREGRVVATQEIRTAGAPARIRLTPDRSTLAADGRDLCYVTVEVTDRDGNLCPWADDDIAFSLQGAATLAGVDNGSPISLERFKADHRRAFYGKCLVVLQTTDHSGTIRLTATADGLEPATVTLKAKATGN